MTDQSVKVRFAPSPTGRIHAGNVRTALINWLFAKKTGGQFLLRFDDTDQARSREQFAAAIIEDLAWLGIVPDETARQSDRFDRYGAAAERLKADGRLYPCYESAEELERKRKRQLASGRPPVYDRAALKLSDGERAALEAEGRTPHWRFRLEDRAVEWDDLVRGPQHFAPGSLSDPVLVRADQSYLYTLPSVVDDIDFGVSHVIRGEDHVANTAVQIQLFEALGAAAPAFAHHNLLVSATGEGLSKRLGALSVAALRERGLEPMAVASHAATIGSSDPVAPHLSLDELAAGFEFAKLSRSPARFDEVELSSLNAKLLHMMPYEDAAERLEALGIGGGAALWEAARANIDIFDDMAIWWRVVDGPVTPVIEDREFCAKAATLLPDAPWDETTWGTWTSLVKAGTGRTGRDLFHPLRLALTGLDHGPELKQLLPLIGPEAARARLAGETD